MNQLINGNNTESVAIPQSAAAAMLPGERLEHAPPHRLHHGLQKATFFFLLSLGALFLSLAFLFNTPYELIFGSIKILTSPANLLTDYIKLANAGAAFFNVGVMTLASLSLVKMSGAKLNGPVLAAIFTVAGFSFFGKNLYNSIPITFGVFLFAKLEQAPMKNFVLQALFGSALGPLVSEISFNLGLPVLQGVCLGILAGILVGLLLPPLSNHFRSFHKGFSLYNTGFTAGIIGMFFLAVLKSFGINVLPVSILSSGNNLPLGIFLYSLFMAMLLLGLYLNRWRFTGYGKLTAQSGRNAPDFLEISSPGVVLLNMALLGILMTSYVLLMGGQLNGPTMGGIFTVAGFGASGKHLKNVVPVLLGVALAKIINIYDESSTAALLAALFGTTLAPIAGYYGAVYGIFAGALHMAVTMNVTVLHGGLNLYNNGFSGGFIAAALVPLIDALHRIRKTRKKIPAETEPD